MNHSSHTTPPDNQTCPSRLVIIELPLATIEELDLLAGLHHITREGEISELIAKALITPPDVLGPDGQAVLAEHARLTRDRSRVLAAEGGIR